MEVRIRRWGAALMLAGLVAGASGAVIAQEELEQNDPGWVTRQIQGLLSGPGRTVTIGRVSSSWSLDVTIYDLAIADDDGVWLNVDQAKLDWAAGALFRREVRISSLDVDRMALERLPAGQHAAGRAVGQRRAGAVGDPGLLPGLPRQGRHRRRLLRAGVPGRGAAVTRD